VKCIEEEIPFDVPEGWAITTIGSICNLQAGKSISVSKIYSQLKKELYPCYGGNGIRGYVEQYSHDGKYPIIGRQGALCGNVNIADGKFYATEHAVVVTSFPKIDIDWLYYTLISLNLNQYATGAAQPGLAVNNLLAIKMLIPPLNEQKIIAKYIRKLFLLITKIEEDKKCVKTTITIIKSKILDLAIRGQLVPQSRNDEPASALLKRIRAEKEELVKTGKIKRDKKESVIFKGEDNSYYETIDKNTICIDDEIPFNIPNGWAWCRLQSISSILTDGTHKTPAYSDSGYMFLSSKNVTSGKIDWENVMYIPDYLHEELYERLAPAKDDILLAKNGTTGIAAIVDRNEVFDIYVSLALIRIVNNLVFPPYVLYAIGSPYVQEYFNSSLKGIGVPNLHLEHIRKTLIPIPPHSEQKQIAELLKNICLKMDDILNILP
jgi:type I restriction enzyme S subunit